MEWQTFPPAVSAVMIAVAGGIAKYMNDIVQGKPFVLSVFLGNVFIAGFTGFMFFQFAESVGMNDKMQSMFSGIGGFMGVEGLRFIQNILLRRFQIRFTEMPEHPGSKAPNE